MNARAQAASRPFEHFVLVQPTAFLPKRSPDSDRRAEFQTLYQELIDDELRTRRVCDDVIESVRNGRSPLVLTERNDHLDLLEQGLATGGRHVVVLRAGMGKKQRQAVADRLAAIPRDEARVILATGKYVGEGFDDPRLDTLFLTLPRMEPAEVKAGFLRRTTETCDRWERSVGSLIPQAHVRIVGVLLLITTGAAVAVAPARFVRFSEARPILTELKDKLPPELNQLTPAQLETAWPGWIERHDQQVRARLEQGDEDTIVNWMLFGTSFTSRPRAVLGAVESGAAGDRDLVVRRTIDLISARLDDLLAALSAPGNDERRLFARALLQRKGLRFATSADRDAARKYLLAAVIRVANEQDQIDQELGATSGDANTEFVQRSRLFRTRGLSLDTSLLPNYSVEQALAAMKTRGLLEPGVVRRVAIVGPGLDFADKDVGFDIYPQQTLQPFAVLDSLTRLGLGPSPGDPDIVLLDISPRIIDHMTQARARAAKNIGYTLNLPLPRSTPWLPEVHTYWQTFGSQMGTPAQAPTSKAIGDLAELRAVRARPSAVRRMSVLNVNIVTERLDGEAFDLVIATNVFIYYDLLEQALAMSNVEAMLKPGAFLLANFSAPNLTSVTIRPVDTTTTRYAQNILDSIVWYKARAN